MIHMIYACFLRAHVSQHYSYNFPACGPVLSCPVLSCPVQVVWENVRILKNSGETVSVDGTHLGHNLPDRKGNRYCINLVRYVEREF